MIYIRVLERIVAVEIQGAEMEIEPLHPTPPGVPGNSARLALISGSTAHIKIARSAAGRGFAFSSKRPNP